MSPRKGTEKGREKLLTEAELELMSLLWKHGPGTVHDVLERLPTGRDLAYTSVSTILRILEQKGFVESRKEGRGHVYAAAVSKEKYEAATLDHVVRKVFDGEPGSLVRRLLEEESLSNDELKALRKLINERLE